MKQKHTWTLLNEGSGTVKAASSRTKGSRRRSKIDPCHTTPTSVFSHGILKKLDGDMPGVHVRPQAHVLLFTSKTSPKLGLFASINLLRAISLPYMTLIRLVDVELWIYLGGTCTSSKYM